MSRALTYRRQYGRPLQDRPRRGTGRIRPVGASLELLERIRAHVPGTISKASADRFMTSLHSKCFDDEYMPSLREAQKAREIFAEEEARAAEAGKPSEPEAWVVVTEVPTLTARQAAVLRFLDEYRSDPHPYVDGMRAKAKQPGWTPTPENEAWVERRAPELFDDVVVHEISIEDARSAAA